MHQVAVNKNPDSTNLLGRIVQPHSFPDLSTLYRWHSVFDLTNKKPKSRK